MSIPLVEWGLFQEQEDVMLYPILEMANRKDDALGLPCGSAPILTETACECGFLLGWLELRQKQGVSDADLLGIERLDRCRDTCPYWRLARVREKPIKSSEPLTSRSESSSSNT